MINSISKLKEHSFKYIKEFMEGCTIEEKIDAHYVSVMVTSPTQLKFFKSSGKEIDRVDLILNAMWNRLFMDWNYLLISDREWFSSHVGATIYMFYLPTSKPILTEYEDGLRYLIDRVVVGDRELGKDVVRNIKFPNEYKVGYKTTLKKVSPEEVDEIYDKNIPNMVGDMDFKHIMRELVAKDAKPLSKGNPEGYIYKFRNKIYQDVLDDSTRHVDKGYAPDNRKVDKERTSYEFLLSTFIKYCRTMDYTDKINISYTKTICNIFNDFIINYEKVNGNLARNIDMESIECPYLGERFDICYEYIPNPITKSICRENVFYKNIFKVLLANLRKGKEYKHCIYMNRMEVDQWNELVKAIRIRVSTD